jgi:hypothetical protein
MTKNILRPFSTFCAVLFAVVPLFAEIRLLNINGQLVQIHNLQGGTTAKTIEIAHFTEGAYFWVLEDNGKTQSRKFV